MTPDDLRAKLDDIRRNAGRNDDERAHILEDSMREEVLTEIAALDFGVCGKMARMALESSKIKFARWCA